MPAMIDSMAYAGATPWHGLGTAVPDTITGDVDAMRVAAGLTWEPTLLKMKYRFQQRWCDADRFAMVRDDDGALLDTVGPDYVPIQNKEVVEFFREYCAAGEMTLETLGSLEGGSYVWALAKMGAGFVLPGKDKVDGYVLLANPHVYGKSGVAKMTGIRVVCRNTLSMALRSKGTAARLIHIGAFDAERRAAVQEEMGIAREQLDAYKANAETLAATKLTDTAARVLVLRIIAPAHPMTADATAEKIDLADPAVWGATPKTVRRVHALYDGAGLGATLPSSLETAWGLLNAVTQYVDWERGTTQDRRVREAWFGAGDALKRRALETLVPAA